MKFTNDQPLIYSSGTQVVSQKDVMAANDWVAHPAGAVGVIVRSPVDRSHAYRVKWKHVMHLIRLLISGTHVLTQQTVIVDVGDHRDQLLRIKRGEMPFHEADAWRKSLQKQFESAFKVTQLPDRPDYHRANQFLIRARRLAIKGELP